MLAFCRTMWFRINRSGFKYKALAFVVCASVVVLLLSSKLSELKRSSGSVAESRDFFADKHITSEGIFPLPPRHTFYNGQKKSSVLPLRFFKHKPGVSAHNFDWITNPRQLCLPPARHQEESRSHEVYLLVAIASAVWEFERRELIRKTWASVANPHGKIVKYVFFLGNNGKPEHLVAVKNEYKMHGDVVMENFAETYKNLTLKTQGQLKWATYFCPNARYVMHVDDDVFADVSGVVEHMLQQEHRRIMHCAKVFKPTVRREGKWMMSKKDYPRSQYPLACVGWCFVMSQDVVNDLYYMSLDTFLIHLEDVTFTGILRERIGDLQLAKMPNGDALCQHKGWPKDKPTNSKLEEAWLKLQAKNAL